jgi:hypothetical protein
MILTVRNASAVFPKVDRFRHAASACRRGRPPEDGALHAAVSLARQCVIRVVLRLGGCTMSENDQPATVFALLLLGAACLVGVGFVWMLRV